MDQNQTAAVTVVHIRRDDLSGDATLSLVPGDHITKMIWQRRDYYERDLLNRLQELLPGGGVAVDVGANVGNHSVYFLRECGVKFCLSIEPNPEALPYLYQNLYGNAQGESFAVVPMAASGPGPLSWTHIGSGRKGNVGTAKTGTVGRAVAAANLSDICSRGIPPQILKNHRIRLLKIDVEGMEADVVAGGMRVISRHRPIVAAECQAQRHGSVDDVDRLLAPLGYTKEGPYCATPVYIWRPEEK